MMKSKWLQVVKMLLALAAVVGTGLTLYRAEKALVGQVKLQEDQDNWAQNGHQMSLKGEALQRVLKWQELVADAHFQSEVRKMEILASIWVFETSVVENIRDGKVELLNEVRAMRREVTAKCGQCRNYNPDIAYTKVLNAFPSSRTYFGRVLNLTQELGTPTLQYFDRDDFEEGSHVEQAAWDHFQASPDQALNGVRFENPYVYYDLMLAVPENRAMWDAGFSGDDILGLVKISTLVTVDPRWADLQGQLDDRGSASQLIASSSDEFQKVIRDSAQLVKVLSSDLEKDRRKSLAAVTAALKDVRLGLESLQTDQWEGLSERASSLGDHIQALYVAHHQASLVLAERSKDGMAGLSFYLYIISGLVVFVAIVSLLRTKQTQVGGKRSIAALNAFLSGDFDHRIKVDKQPLSPLHEKINQMGEALALSVPALIQATGKLSDITLRLSQTVESSSDSVAEGMSRFEELNQNTEKMVKTENDMARNIEEVSNHANEVAQHAEKVSGRLVNIRGATEEMSVNVNQIAEAIEQVASTLHEVSENADAASSQAAKASSTADTTASTVNELGESAMKIGDVVDLIKGIAAQTNLLALNATIEAASAGEAGRGFAVVANEVKDLAKKTTTATEEISRQVLTMQENTERAVSAINEIVTVINAINESFSSMAASVAQQTSTVSEISNSVSSSAKRASEVSENLQEATEGVTQIATGINELAESSSEVTFSIYTNAEAVNQVSKNLEELKGSLQTIDQSDQNLQSVLSEVEGISTGLTKAIQSLRADVQAKPADETAP